MKVKHLKALLADYNDEAEIIFRESNFDFYVSCIENCKHCTKEVFIGININNLR